MTESFQQQLKKAASFFDSFSGPVKLVSHHDADGICAAAIMVSLLNKKGLSYSISIIPQLDAAFLEDLAKESYSNFIFTDLGSSQLQSMQNLFEGRNVIVLDHHQTKEYYTKEICHVNPHLFGINGSRDISGAGVVYLMARKVNSEIEKLSHLAVIGAIGDCQERNGFNGLNNEILDFAIKAGKIEVRESLRLFGAQTKPLTRLLKQNYDPYVPGVSGNFRGAINFLKDLGIETRANNKPRMLADLADSELQRLTKALEEKISPEKKKNLRGSVYIIPSESGAFSDAREFSTILNSCGRLEKATTGLAACLGDKRMKEKAEEVLKDYKKELQDIVEWFKNNRGTSEIIEAENYIIVNAKTRVMPSIAGTFASIIAHSNEIQKGTLVLTMSRNGDNTTKISLRIAGGSHGTDADLNYLISRITKTVGGEYGGHKNAAGALIDSGSEEKFMQEAKRVFQETSIEERVY